MNAVTDMSSVIVPRSDQVNAEDYLSGPKSYVIEAVSIAPGTEQPVSIKLAGESRVWKPCKSMSRVLVAAWGPDASVYAGRSLTLFCDPKVKWGGMEVGGIRVSHMSHIERDMLLQLSVTKGKRAPTIIKPLTAEVRDLPKQRQTAEQWAADHITAVQNAADSDALDELLIKGAKPMAKLQGEKPELWNKVNTAYTARRGQLEQTGKPDTETGEGFGDDAFAKDPE